MALTADNDIASQPDHWDDSKHTALENAFCRMIKMIMMKTLSSVEVSELRRDTPILWGDE